MEEDQSRMASRQNFADTVCKIRRVRDGFLAFLVLLGPHDVDPS